MVQAQAFTVLRQPLVRAGLWGIPLLGWVWGTACPERPPPPPPPSLMTALHLCSAREGPLWPSLSCWTGPTALATGAPPRKALLVPVPGSRVQSLQFHAPAVLGPRFSVSASPAPISVALWLQGPQAVPLPDPGSKRCSPQHTCCTVWFQGSLATPVLFSTLCPSGVPGSWDVPLSPLIPAPPRLSQQ